MNRNAKLRCIFCCSFSKFSRYSLAVLMGAVLLSDSVGATFRNTQLQIPKQAELTFQEAIPVAAKRAFEEKERLYLQGTAESQRQVFEKWQEVLTRQQQIGDLFSGMEVAVIPANAKFGQYPIKIAQSPATKPQNINPAPSAAAAKFNQLIDKANQLRGEALQLQAQPSAEAKQQAIAKYEELLKIWRLPEVRAAIPKDARILEADALSSIGSIYSLLSENKKAVKLKEQALAIFQELKEPKARFLETSTFFTLAPIYGRLGEKQKAIDAFTQAQSLFHADNKPDMEAQALFGIASVYSTFGEPKKMLEPLNQALAIQKANPNSQQAFITQGNVLGAIASAYQTLGETDKALEYYQQALQFYCQTKDLSGQASTLSSVGSVYASRNEHKQAEEYFQQALELQKTIQRQLQQTLPPASSVAVPQKNATLEQIQQKTQAELARYQYFNQQFSILNTIATNYNLMGDSGQEIAYLNQALAVAREGRLTQYEADILSNIGEAYSFLGETEKAKDFLKQALKLQRAINHPQGEAETLKKIAFVSKNSGEFQQALDNLNQSLEIHKQQQNSSLEGQTLSDMALVYKDLGAYDLSIDKYEQALKIFQQKNPLVTASTLYLTGIAYWQRGKSQKTPEDYHLARKSFEMALNYARQQGSVVLEASNLSSLARTYESLKNYPQAIANANQALELSRKHNLKDAQATALNVLSIVYQAAGDYQKALDANKQALSLSQQLVNISSQASAYQNQGKIYTSMKQPQQAIEAYNQELKLGQQISDISHETIALRQMAMIERDRGNLNQAKTHIDTAINIIENTRTKVSSNDWRTSYFATVQDYYQFYIDLLMRLHKKDPSKRYNADALHISERSRARGLIELLNSAGAEIRKGVDPQLLEEERRLQLLLDAREKLLSEQLSKKYPPKQLVAATEKEIENLLNQYKEVEAKIRATNPEYARLTNPNPERDILKLPQIQQQLDKDTILLQYSLGKEHSYLWAVTPDSFQSYELPKEEEIKNAANNFSEHLKKCQNLNLKCEKLSPEQKAKDLEETAKAANELSKLILTPVAGKLGKKRLVIVADGALQEIPFAALADLTPQPPSLRGKGEQDKLPGPPPPNPLLQGGGQGAAFVAGGAGGEVNYQPLIVNHEIINLPSVTAIATHRQKLKGRQPAPKALAILADPVFEADDKRLTGKDQSIVDEFDLGSQLEQSNLKRAARNLNRVKWYRLPGTGEEAKAILKLVPPSDSLSAFDFDANYNWATNKQLKQYRFLLFATHGFAEDNNPELSGIVLSLLDKQGKPTRGHLRLGDIFNLDWAAELVVLSACDTGLGKDVKGEGMMALTRGLMYAGAKQAVVTLWQINDKGTLQLMPEFYKEMLQQGKSPTTALRDAQLKMWQEENWRNPYYWAAFTLQGEWR